MAGIPPWRFWTLTRGELAVAMQAADKVAESARKAALRYVWHTAALIRNRKRNPSLDTFVNGPPKPQPVEDPVKEARELAELDAALEAEAARNRAAMNGESVGV